MKRIDKKIENRMYKCELFDSVLEMAEINGRRMVTDAWKDNCLKGVNSEWSGVTSKEEAYSLLKNGWEEATKKINKEVCDFSKNSGQKRTEFFNNVMGFQPVVPLSLLNVPNCMIDSRSRTIKTKVLRIVYDISASSGVTSDQMLSAGKNLVETIINLENNGYRCELYVIDSYCDTDNYEKKIDICAIKIKDANQMLNLRKMMFPMAHSAQLRVVGFDWQDKTPIAHYISGRGKPFYVATNKYGVPKSDLKQVFGENTVYLTYNETKYGTGTIMQNIKRS